MVPVEADEHLVAPPGKITDSYPSRSVELIFGDPDRSIEQKITLYSKLQFKFEPWSVALDESAVGYLNSSIPTRVWRELWETVPRHFLRDREEQPLAADARLNLAYQRMTYIVGFRDGEARISPGNPPGPLLEAGMRERRATTMAIFTACNPTATSLGNEIDLDRAQRALATGIVDRHGLALLEARAEPSEMDVDWKYLPGLAVFDIPVHEAVEIGKQFGLQAIVHVTTGEVAGVFNCRSTDEAEVPDGLTS